jgi:hypothetical protein
MIDVTWLTPSGVRRSLLAMKDFPTDAICIAVDPVILPARRSISSRSDTARGA